MKTQKRCLPKNVYLRGETYWCDVTVNGRRMRHAAGETPEEAEQLALRLKAAAAPPAHSLDLPRVSKRSPSPRKVNRPASARGAKRSVTSAGSIAKPRATVPTASGPSFDDLVDRYLERAKIMTKPQSFKSARTSSARLLTHFGGRPVSSLDPDDLRRFISMRLRTVTREFINRDLRYLKAIIRLALEEERITRPPFKVQLLRTTKRLPTILTASELTRLFDAAEPRVRPMLMTAAMTGLRAGELRALEWGDVDLVQRALRVRAKPAIGFSPKSHAEREIPINVQLATELQAHRDRLTHDGDSDPVFQCDIRHGSRWGDSGLCRAVRGVFVSAGLYRTENRPGLHMLRRSFASHALKHTDIETVRELGGWSELGVVQRYVVSSGPRKRAAVERLVFDEEEIAD